MEIYVHKSGQRRGPYLPFKLRELLEDKEFLPTDLGWIEGMEAWAPLREMEPLKHWMPRDPTVPPPLPEADEEAVVDAGNEGGEAAGVGRRGAAGGEVFLTDAEVKGRRVKAGLRWLARTVDEMLWYVFLWVVGVSVGWLEIWDFLFRHPVLLFGPALVWVPVEAYLLSTLTTTPGKWLLGMRVTDDLGQPLSYMAALKRSALVLVMGNGLGLPTLMLLPMLQAGLSWVLYQRSGSTFWDRASGARFLHQRPASSGYVVLGGISLGWMVLGMWIALTSPIPPDTPAEQRGPIEEMRQKIQENWKVLQTPPPVVD